MWPIMVGTARSRSTLRLSMRTRTLFSRPKAITTTAVVWIAMVRTMSARPTLQLARSTHLAYHPPRRQTVASAASGRLRACAQGYPAGGSLRVEVSHGRLRDSGSVGASGPVPCRGGGGCGLQHMAGASHPPRPGERGAQRSVVAVLDLCRP